MVAAVIVGGVTWFVRSRSIVREDSPAWAPSGRRLAFASVRNGARDLIEVSVDGRDRRDLTTTAADEKDPAYSPDGSELAFVTNRDGNDEIYVMTLPDGSPAGAAAPRRLTNHAARDLAPAWSPDRSQILFLSDRDAEGQFDVYLMRADGTDVERLTTTGANACPRFAPDGRRIALQAGDAVHLFDLKTRTLLPLTRESTTGSQPTWSPDGTRLAFMSARSGRSQIFTMNADGTDTKLLVTMARGGAVDPRWSPDGSRVAFVHVPDEAAAGGPRTIYVAEIATGKLTRISR